MVNKLLALVLSFVLLCCALPVVGMAATYEEKEELKAATKSSYYKSLATYDKESFHGFCGAMISRQLWHMGINPYLLTADGNKQYDLYSAMKKTTGGYYTCSYSAEEYTLESALKTITCNGTKDVYNLLVGFEWTDTPAGAAYGHAVVINGILDGIVYFVESYDSARGGPEGTVIMLSIDEFVDMYEGWSLFEGIVHFAGKTYTEACKEFPTDMFVRARFAMELRSHPCLVGQEDCQVLRSVAAGERLRVTAVLRNQDDEWYYRVVDGDRVGYLVADTVVPVRTNVEDITMESFAIDLPGEETDDLQLSGSIYAENGLIGVVEVTVADEKGEVIRRLRRVTDAHTVNLRNFNDGIDFSELDDGAYTVSVCADTAFAYIEKGKLQYSAQTQLLAQQVLLIGDAEAPAQSRMTAYKEEKSGWYWENGTWFRYKNDKPQTGWLRELGIMYYLKEDGSVTTGTAEIDGTVYYFSETGAMCTGWMISEETVCYLLSDGTMATGWQIIGGSRYCFDDDGNMICEGTMKDGDREYTFQADGKAIEVRK